jgi:hypothetical protein
VNADSVGDEDPRAVSGDRRVATHVPYRATKIRAAGPDGTSMIGAPSDMRIVHSGKATG